MEVEYSEHWRLKKRYRSDITDEFIKYAISNSNILKDKYWENALNAICRIPPSGRILKVVYRKTAKDKIKVITAFWLD
ncbi:MAG: hypothetical protein HYX24_06515 [Candidatus Aenigmarchaeota archaeon]|nr:hypothetical protein [Candidatus Aenigmarchaeota archaeon]